MAIDSISLLAQNTYNQVQNRPKVSGNQDVIANEAVSFQKIIQKDFNSFAKMSPEQILQHIQQSRSGAVVNNTVAAGVAVSGVRRVLASQEDLVRKSLINEASLVDVLTATTEATNAMKTIVEIRNKFMEAFEKVLNMSI